MFGCGLFKKAVTYFILAVFFLAGIPGVYAQSSLTLPAAGSRLELSAAFVPPLLKGIRVFRNDPFRLDFILDKGASGSTDEALQIDSTRLIRYFLASLTVPEKDLWVNLSPYEKDRIVPDGFGETEMGRDLLAQDYILKQITASVIYPEGDIGRAFWGKVYAEAYKRYGRTDIPLDTFNKVWIVPEKATVYENRDAAFVVESRLKVMLEKDYLAQEKNRGSLQRQISGSPEIQKLAEEVLREVVIPVLEKEVNEGASFAPLRQVYAAHILATWYKRKIRKSLMAEAYVDKGKTAGVEIEDKGEKDRIWAQYVEAFQKGAFNFVKEEQDEMNGETIPRKYFSGGTDLAMSGVFKTVQDESALPADDSQRLLISVEFKTADVLPEKDADQAMSAVGKFEKIIRPFTKPELTWQDVPPKTRQIMARASSRSLKTIVENVGPEESEFIFGYALETLASPSNFSDDDMTRRWDDLVEMSRYAREQTGDLFKEVFPHLKRVLGAERFRAYWPAFTDAVRKTGWYSAALLNFSLPAVKDIVTTENVREVLGILGEFAGPEAGEPEVFYQYAVPIVSRRVKSIEDLRFWVNRLKQAVRFMDSEQVALFVHDLDNDRVLDGLRSMKDEDAANPFAVAQLLLKESSGGYQDILHIFLEPLAFRHAGELTSGLLKEIGSSFPGTRDLKYFLYYISVNSQTRDDVRGKARHVMDILKERDVFSWHGPIERLLAKGAKKVLIVQNIDDGVGDEELRVMPVLNGLLAFNPDLQVTVVTGKPDLYNHPRINIISMNELFSSGIQQAVQLQTAAYDAVINFYDENLPYYSHSIEMAVRTRNKGGLFITTGKGREDSFTFDKVFIHGVEYASSLGLDQPRVESVYEPSFRLLAELGIPISAVGAFPREGSAMTALPYVYAEELWAGAMKELKNENHAAPVILFTPYGGQLEAKGFTRSESDRKELQEYMTKFVEKGFKVVLLSNGTTWGSLEVAQESRAGLPETVRSSVAVVDMKKDFRVPTYFSFYADFNLTVEGKMGHTAGNIGKPFREFLRPGASDRKWIPYGQAEYGAVDNIDQILIRFQDQWRSKGRDGGRGSASKSLGGIDLNADRIDLMTKSAGAEMEFDFSPAQLEALRAASGIQPVIIKAEPLKDIRRFLTL